MPWHSGRGVSRQTKYLKTNQTDRNNSCRYRCGQLRYLPESYNGLMHRVPGKSGIRHQRGVHRRLGRLQSCLSFPLHFTLAKDASGLPAGQPRMGLPKVRTLIPATQSTKTSTPHSTHTAYTHRHTQTGCRQYINQNRLTGTFILPDSNCILTLDAHTPMRTVHKHINLYYVIRLKYTSLC